MVRGVVAALRALQGVDADAHYARNSERLLAQAHPRDFELILREFGDGLVCAAVQMNSVALAKRLITIIGFNGSDSLLARHSQKLQYLAMVHGAYHGCLQVLEALLGSGLSTFNVKGYKGRDTNGESALYIACSRGHLEVVQLFLRHGASTNFRTSRGLTPASIAIQHGHDECLRVLLMAGADPELRMTWLLKKSHGRRLYRAYTLLELAILLKRPRAVSMLLRALSSRPTYLYQLGNALGYSLSKRKMSFLIPRMLLNAGADSTHIRLRVDVGTGQPYLETPSFCAVMNGNEHLARFFLRECGSLSLNSLVNSLAVDGVEVEPKKNFACIRSLLRLGFSLQMDQRLYDVWDIALFADNVRLAGLLHRYGPTVIRKTPSSYYSPLYVAALVGARKCVDFLLAAGADPNEQHTPFPLAAAMIGGDETIYSALLRAGADSSIVGDHGLSAVGQYLRGLRMVGNEEDRSLDSFNAAVFEKFCHTSDVDSRCSEIGETALYYAVRYGLVSQTTFLLNEAGAKVNHRSQVGSTPLIDSIRGGWRTCLQVVLDASPDISLRTSATCVVSQYVNVRMACGMDAFLFAAFFCDVVAVQALADRGANVHSRDDRGRNAIWLAILDGHGPYLTSVRQVASVVRLLLGLGTPASSTDTVTGIQSVHVAAREGIYTALHALTRHGADINSTDHGGNTALHWAAMNRDAPGRFMTALVVDLSADVTAKNSAGETALHIASRRCAVASAISLLDAGGDVNARDTLGRTPLMLACCQGKQQSAKSDANEGSLKHKLRNSSSTVRALLSRGANPSCISGRGLQALHYAATGGFAGSCRLLLMRNVNVNARSASGRTALHFAGRHGNSAIVEILMVQGAEVDVRDARGRTPMQEAVNCGDVSCVSMLLRFGASASASLVSAMPRVLPRQEESNDRKRIVTMLVSAEKGRLNAVAQHHLSRNSSPSSLSRKFESEMMVMGCEDLLIGSELQGP